MSSANPADADGMQALTERFRKTARNLKRLRERRLEEHASFERLVLAFNDVNNHAARRVIEEEVVELIARIAVLELEIASVVAGLPPAIPAAP